MTIKCDISWKGAHKKYIKKMLENILKAAKCKIFTNVVNLSIVSMLS